MKQTIRAFFTVQFLLAGALSLDAYQWDAVRASAIDLSRLAIRENREIRESLRDLLSAPTSEVLKFRRKVFAQKGSEGRVAAEVRKSGDSFYILFLNEEQGAFPVSSKGSWVVKRNLADGAFVQVKIFYQSDPGTFLRIFPSGERTVMDVYLYDRIVYRDVPMGMRFQDVLTSGFEEIVDLTKGTVSWETLVPSVEPKFYHGVVSMVEKIRAALPGLPDAEDGAMDENGRLVFIENLAPQDRLPGFNCSGFAKWVADGIHRVRTGKYLDIVTLKTKREELRGNPISRKFEDARDPFFGLDWSRNIATALAALDSLSENAAADSQDVRNLPFWKYKKDIGFPSEDLKAILHHLAVTEPGNFYIGSVCRQAGRNPVLLQHVHLAVFFPYFDSKGNFRLSVMERNVETPIDAFMKRYTYDFIHLVRVRADADFVPPVIGTFLPASIE